MAIFQLQTRATSPLDQGARAERLYSIDGIPFWPPPEDFRAQNNYRVSIKQVAAGQVADKGGVGGCEIEISGMCPWKDAEWLLALQELFVARASDAEFVVFYDPISQRSYECVVRNDSISVSVGRPHTYVYSISLWGQVLGAAWIEGSLVTEGDTSPIQAFDLESLGWILADVEASAQAASKPENPGGVASGSGNQPPTPIDNPQVPVPETLK